MTKMQVCDGNMLTQDNVLIVAGTSGEMVSDAGASLVGHLVCWTCLQQPYCYGVGGTL